MTLTEFKLSEQGIEKLRWVITALLVSVVTYQGYLLARQVWEWVMVPVAVEHFDIKVIAANLPTQENNAYNDRYKDSLPYQLFGEYVPPKPKIEELPVTELDIQLLAIMHSSKPQESAVMLASDGESKLYYQGDKLPNGVEIKEIFANQITLSQNNKVERLLMDNLLGDQYTGMFNASQPLGSSMDGSGSKPPVYDPGDQSDELESELEALRDLLNTPT